MTQSMTTQKSLTPSDRTPSVGKSPRSARWWVRLSLCLFIGAGSTPLAWSQDNENEAGIAYPLQVLHVAGINRAQEKLDAIFLAAERPEMLDVMQNWMDETLRGFSGVDRTKPLGMMFYLKPGLSLGAATISYLPVTDVKEALQFLAGKEGVIRELPGESNRYEITDVGWGPGLAVKHVNDYIFLVMLDDAAELDRKFPAPERLVGKLSNRYDIAYSLLLKNIPPNTKKLFFELFKSQALAGLQQRDDEPDAAYRVRRASGESVVDLLDMIVSQGEELTIGAFSRLDEGTGYLEIELNGTKTSGLAEFFQRLAGRRSYFAPAVNEASTLTINTSVQLDEKRRKPFVEAFATGVENVKFALRTAGKPDDSAERLAPFFQSLQNTAEEGRLDLFLQLGGTELGDYRLVGGFRVLAVGDFPKQMADFLAFGKETADAIPAAGQRAAMEGLQLNESSIDGIPVHLLPLPAPRDSTGRNMFGETPNLYLCATPQAFWFAVGQKSAREQLGSYISAAQNGPSPDQLQRTSPPFLLTTNAAQWVTVGLGEQPAPEDGTFLNTVVSAFEPGKDRLRVTGSPTDTGTRVRFDAEAGYVEWIGRAIAQQFDSNMRRSAEREQRMRNRPQGGRPAPAQRPAQP